MSLKRVSHRRDDALARTDWAEVERLLASHYRHAGFEVDHCGTGSGAPRRYDGGVDLKLRRNGEYIVVQCKHWNAMKVPHNDVHQLIGLMVNEGATGALLVTRTTGSGCIPTARRSDVRHPARGAPGRLASRLHT